MALSRRTAGRSSIEHSAGTEPVATSPELTHWPGSLQNSVRKLYQERHPLGKNYRTVFNSCILFVIAHLECPRCE
jgi:hypothetical protein